MAPLKLGQYLQDVVGINFCPQERKALDVLTGKTLGEMQFESQVYTDIYAHLTPFFYAFGHFYDDELGYHLHPIYVGQEQLILGHHDHGMVTDRCTSLAEYVMYHLQYLEESVYGYEEDPKDDETLTDAIALANEAFGENFYEIGRSGDFSSYEVEPPEFISDTAVSMDVAARKMLKVFQSGDTEMAASLCAKMLSTYRSTAEYQDLTALYQRCLPLLDLHPEYFKAEHHRELTLDRDNQQAYVEWFAELYKTENKPWATKILLDFCDAHCSYDHPIAHALLVKLLGDTPAGRWVQQRQTDDVKRPCDFKDWENVLASL